MRKSILIVCVVVVGLGWFSIASGAPLFYGDFSGGLNWTTSDSSVSISNGNLVIGTGGGYGDWAEKTLSIGLSTQSPIIVEQRVKLQSGGLNYRLPYEQVSFEDSSQIIVTYLPSGSGQAYGWQFNGWTGNESNPVPGGGSWTSATADYWAVTKMVLTPTGGELYVKPDDAARGWFSNQYSKVAEANWSHTSIEKIRFEQPWDSVNRIDYISITPEPATLTLLTLGGLALIRRRRSC